LGSAAEDDEDEDERYTTVDMTGFLTPPTPSSSESKWSWWPGKEGVLGGDVKTA
jgi:hypothetical protein